MPVSDNHLTTKPFSSKDRMARRWVNMKLSCNVGTSIGDLYQDDRDTHLHDQKNSKKYIRESSGTIAEEREVLGRPYCCIGAFTEVHNFEHGEGMFGDLLIVRNQQPWFG